MRDDGLGLGRVLDELAEESRVRAQACLVQAAERHDGLIQGFAGDELRGAEAHPVLPDEAPDARAVGRCEDQLPEHYAAWRTCSSSASSSARSAAVSPRSGARTSSRIGTPLRTSTCLSAAWRG